MMTREEAPFFSIIIPTYNRATFLKRAMRSVLDQTFENWELVVVNDGSSDHTDEVVNSFQDKRVTYIKQNNKGVSKARNNGISHSRGRFICFLDSDDEFKPEHLQTFKNYLDSSDYPVEMLYTLPIIGEDGAFNPLEIPDANPNKLEEVVADYIPYPSTVCVHRDILDEETFETSFDSMEDVELWARIALKFPVRRIPEYTAIYHSHGDNVSSFTLKFLKTAEKGWTIIFNNPKYRKRIAPRKRRDKFAEVYIALADKYSRMGSVRPATKYLFKSLTVKPFLVLKRQIWGISRNILKGITGNLDESKQQA